MVGTAVSAGYGADVLVGDMVAVGCFSPGLLYRISQLYMKCIVAELHVSIIFYKLLSSKKGSGVRSA